MQHGARVIIYCVKFLHLIQYKHCGNLPSSVSCGNNMYVAKCLLAETRNQWDLGCVGACTSLQSNLIEEVLVVSRLNFPYCCIATGCKGDNIIT